MIAYPMTAVDFRSGQFVDKPHFELIYQRKGVRGATPPPEGSQGCDKDVTAAATKLSATGGRSRSN